MMVAPFFHVVYNPLVLGAHRQGGAAAIPANLQARVAVREAERSRATAIMGTPFFFMQLLNDRRQRAPDLGAIETVIYGAAPTPVPVIRALRERFPGARLFNCYGLTETCSAVSCLASDELEGHEGSVGRAHPGVEVSIRGEDHRELGPGEVGEVYCRGANVITGYYKAPEADTTRFHAGCSYRRHVHLSWTGTSTARRCDDLINVAGEKAYPSEVEAVPIGIRTFDAAVTVVPDAAKGRREAFVVPRRKRPRRGRLRGSASATFRTLSCPGLRARRVLPRNPTAAPAEAAAVSLGIDFWAKRPTIAPHHPSEAHRLNPVRRRSIRKRSPCRCRGPLLGPKAMEVFLRRRYGDRVVTPAKVRNFIQAHRDMFERAAEVQSLPWILNLDTFSGCNLKCPFCPTGTGQLERSKARMPVARAKRIIDLVKDHVLEIRLYNWGEPFLNPDIFEITRYATTRASHGDQLDLSVSVPTWPGRSSSPARPAPASVDGWFRIARSTAGRQTRTSLLQRQGHRPERTRQGVTHPSLELALLVFRHNEHELRSWRRSGASWARMCSGPPRLHLPRLLHPRASGLPAHAGGFHGTCDYLYSELTIEGQRRPSRRAARTWRRSGTPRRPDRSTCVLSGTARSTVPCGLHGGDTDAARHAPGRALLCQHCDLVGAPGLQAGPPLATAAGLQGRRPHLRPRPGRRPYENLA